MIEALWFCNILLFISTVLLIIDSSRLVKEIKKQRKGLDKIEDYSEAGSNFYTNTKGGTFIEGLDDYKPQELYSLSAVDADKLKIKSVTQIEVDSLLKPVFFKIKEASERGDSEVFLSGSGWYYNKNEKYKVATQKLNDLGYSTWKNNDGFGINVKW